MTGTTGGSRIHILDQATVNKIAAGEVVERPASVVKELAENAIDAGGITIRIEIVSKQGVISSIRVADDGSGMSYKDALLAFTPHATSKISRAADLETVQTLGFRGEALASIAAVAKVTLVTREQGSIAAPGIKIVIEGGVLKESGETGAPEGTSVLVEDLFFNTPARKKFLKSLPTEIAHITDVVEGIALARPEARILLIHNGRDILATERSGKLIDTVVRIFGPDVASSMIPVHYQHPLITVQGFISLPTTLRRNPGRILIAINRRYVSSMPVMSAILEGYGSFLPNDRYPVAFLSLLIDVKSVDVNVHPAKKLIRLSREGQVRDIVRDAVRTALRAADLIPSPLGAVQQGTKQDTASLPAALRHTPAPVHPAAVSEPTHAGVYMTDRQLRQTELTTGTEHETGLLPEMELIGQFGGIYLVAASAGGDLFIIDQHAAHERIMYDMISERNESLLLSQELIVPVILERTARDAAVIRSLLPLLAEEGFTIGEFGRNSFIVSAVPVVLGKAEDAVAMITEIADDLSNEELRNPVTRREQVTRIIACRGAIKAGTVCTGDQCRRLLQQLARTKNPHTCPHGRPTILRFSRMELDTMFKRT